MREILTSLNLEEKTMFMLPACPQNSHKMQHLDLAFMKPQKASYPQVIESLLWNYFPRIVTVRQFGNAYLRAAAVEIAVNGLGKAQSIQ
jgi:hypothetical protein